MGVPVRYCKEVVDTILESLVEGCSFKEAASRVGMPVSTLRNWRKERPDFEVLVKEALYECAQNKVPRLQHALFQKATGYEVSEEKTTYISETYMDDDGQIKERERVKKREVVKKQIPPDTSALVFALTNLNPERWKQKKDVVETKNININTEEVVDFDKLTDEELLQMAAIMDKAKQRANKQIGTEVEFEEIKDGE